MSNFRIALPLALSVAVTPFAVDTYLPAFPAMAEHFAVDMHQISFSIAIYIFALAIGQLVGGPLADRFGRPVVMMSGISVYILTSLAITQLEQFHFLLIMRAIQAFGGAWVMVCIPALVRDRVKGKEAAKLFSLIGLMAIAAPAIAPSIGAFLMQWGWQTIFFFLTLYGLVALSILRFILFKHNRIITTQSNIEKLPSSKNPSFLKRYITVLNTTGALRYVFLQGMLFSIMMLFVTHASFVYQVHYKVTSSTFSLLFAANIFTMWLTMVSNRILLNKFQPKTILTTAVCIQSLAVLAMLLITSYDLPMYLYTMSLTLTVGMLGATSPNCQACYMEHFDHNSGTASALMGAMQFGIAGIMSGISTLLPEDLSSLSVAQMICSLCAVLLILLPNKISSGITTEISTKNNNTL